MNKKKTLIIVIIILLIATMIAVVVLLHKDRNNSTPSGEPRPEDAVLVQNEDGSIELPEDTDMEDGAVNDKKSDVKEKSSSDPANSNSEQGETAEDEIE